MCNNFIQELDFKIAFFFQLQIFLYRNVKSLILFELQDDGN